MESNTNINIQVARIATLAAKAAQIASIHVENAKCDEALLHVQEAVSIAQEAQELAREIVSGRHRLS